MSINVRRSSAEDIATLRDVRLRAIRDSPAAFGTTIERELARTDAQWLGWLDPGRVYFAEQSAGFAEQSTGVGRANASACGIVCSKPDPAEPGLVWLLAMWVAPEARGSGAGDLLVQRVLADARTVGATTVALLVIDTNHHARRLYERNGFVDSGRREIRDRDGAVELELRRSLGTDS